MNKKEIVKEIITYINDRFDDRSHGDGYWVMPDGTKITEDVGYAYEWWTDCMVIELSEKYDLD